LYQVVPASVAAKNPAVQNSLPFGGGVNEFAVDAAAAKGHNGIHKQKQRAMKQIQRLLLFVVAVISLAVNAHAGRWLSRDPMEVQEHMERDPHPFLDLNPYTFVRNNPLHFVDPFGLDSYVVNAGGYTGHTSFVVDNPAGGVIAYHSSQSITVVTLLGTCRTWDCFMTVSTFGHSTQIRWKIT